MWSKLLNRIRRRPEAAEPAPADQAVAESARSLEEALNRDHEVRQVAAEIRYHRVEVNHFAERIRASMTGGTL